MVEGKDCGKSMGSIKVGTDTEGENRIVLSKQHAGWIKLKVLSSALKVDIRVWITAGKNYMDLERRDGWNILYVDYERNVWVRVMLFWKTDNSSPRTS